MSVEFYTIIAAKRDGTQALPTSLPSSGSWSRYSHVRSYDHIGKARNYRTRSTNEAQAKWGDEAPAYEILKVTVHNDATVTTEWVE